MRTGRNRSPATPGRNNFLDIRTAFGDAGRPTNSIVVAVTLPCRFPERINYTRLIERNGVPLRVRAKTSDDGFAPSLDVWLTIESRYGNYTEAQLRELDAAAKELHMGLEARTRKPVVFDPGERRNGSTRLFPPRDLAAVATEIEKTFAGQFTDEVGQPYGGGLIGLCSPHRELEITTLVWRVESAVAAHLPEVDERTRAKIGWAVAAATHAVSPEELSAAARTPRGR